MKIEQVKEIANAVLFEGYLLYPYRHSAIKNRQRWTYGVVYPREYSEANGGIEPWTMRTECLVAGQGKNTSLDISVRFLHLLVRTVVHTTDENDEVNNTRTQTRPEGGNYGASLMASHLANEPWEEGIEREVSVVNLSLSELVTSPRSLEIAFPGALATATIVREQYPLQGAVIIAAEPVGEDLYKLSVSIENRTTGTGEVTNQHNAVLRHSFVSTHTILQVHQGAYISLLEPPDALKSAVQQCHNFRTWPVLVGNKGDCDTLLSSPIILYDYPQIAPESPGTLFDGTEIDEILTLRILTLTDEEKQQIRQGDERVREMLERTESITPEQFMKLHGTIRSLQPVGQVMEEDGLASSGAGTEIREGVEHE